MSQELALYILIAILIALVLIPAIMFWQITLSLIIVVGVVFLVAYLLGVLMSKPEHESIELWQEQQANCLNICSSAYKKCRTTGASQIICMEGKDSCDKYCRTINTQSSRAD